MNRDDVTRMAREAGFVGMDGDHGALRRFAALVAAAEREACLRVCRRYWSSALGADGTATAIAAAIEARRQA